VPGPDLDPLPDIPLFPAVDEDPVFRGVPRKGHPVPETAEEIGRDGFRGFDLHGNDGASQVDDQVDLVAGLVPPEEQRGILAGVGEHLVDLGQDERLEDVPAQGVGGEVLLVPDPQEVAEQAAVQEIQLRRPDDPFREVPGMGAKQEDEGAGLQDGKRFPEVVSIENYIFNHTNIFVLPPVDGVSTGALNQAMKRNAERFPGDFMFRLTAEEGAYLKSQIVISNGWGGRRRFLPRRRIGY